MNPRLVRACVSLALASALWGCSVPNVDLADAEAFYRRADYYQAYHAVVRARRATPDDPEVERAYWRMRRAFLLQEAQRLVFGNREEEALERLEKVLVLDPDNAIALRWRDKAIGKLAERHVDHADDLVAAGDLEDALREFDQALAYDPGNKDARDGLDRLGATWKKEQTEARGHYMDGIRALGDHEYRRTRYHLGIAIDKDPTLTEAREPAAVAERQLVEERFAQARRMEDDGYYAPALREYEIIRDSHPEMEGLEERIARATAELEASRLADEGEIAVYRGDFAGARELLNRAFELTTRQREPIGDRLLLARERELDQRYQEAKDLELQRLLEEAVASFVAIEEEQPGFLDVRARISDLRLRIEEATKAYDAGLEAEQNGDLEEAIDQLTDVQLFWKGFRDSRARLDDLRKRRDAARSGG